jgi:surface protein
LKHKCYIVDITNLKDVDSLTDFMYILYNEYVLNSEYTFDEKLRVYTYNDSDESKLKRALKKYKADKSYIDSIFKKDVKESSNIKLNNKPMKFSEYVKVSEGIDNRYEKNDVEYVEDYDEDYDEDYNEKDEKNFDDNILQNIADAINDLFIDGYVIDDTSDINDVINKVDTKLYFLYNTSLINYGIETVSDFCGVMNKINEKGLLNGNVDESVKENTKNKKINKMSDSKVRQSVMRESASDRYKSIIKKRHINESNMNIVQPKTRNELKSLIDKTIEEQGTACDLNFIDTSLITNMSGMFRDSIFNGDISSWDVFRVTDMSDMFSHSKFNGDISSWDVSNVTNMSDMFSHSKFNGDISSWDVSNVTDMSKMFYNCPCQFDVSSWDLSNVIIIKSMLYNSKVYGILNMPKIDKDEIYILFEK